MTTLTDFLLARIAEDEEIARSAALPPWKHEGYAVANHTLIVETDDVEDAEHIARWDPTRVLAECEAKRRIVELHRSDIGADPCDAHDASLASVDCDTLLALAQVYADHPDFDPAWTV